jgi:hypothetical protein
MPSPGDIFLACYDCGVLRPIAPPYANGVDSAAMDGDDSPAFAAEHATHRTGQLVRHGDDTASDRPLWDPMHTVSFQVTDGEHGYVVIGSRESIDEPRTYRFSPGSLEARNSEVLVDDRDLRRGLDQQFFPHALRPTKVDQFLSVIHDVVRHIPPDGLEIAFDDAQDPEVSIARMPTDSYQELLTRCTEIFDPWEWPHVSRFLHENCGEDGLLALRVRRQVSLLGA